MFKTPIGLYEKDLPDELSRKERLTVTSKVGYDFVKSSIDESVEMDGQLHTNKGAIDSVTTAQKFVEGLVVKSWMTDPQLDTKII